MESVVNTHESAPSTVRMPGTPPRWVNRLMSVGLRTPVIRSWLGKSFALITVTGARSGNRYTTPVQYNRIDGAVIVLSQRHRRWWRNIESVPAVDLLVRGRSVAGDARIASGDDGRELLRRCLVEQPRVAKFYGIDVRNGPPDPISVHELLDRVVLIEIDPVDATGGPDASASGLSTAARRSTAERVHGGVEEGYGPVADAFRANFDERGEVGAACVVIHDGRTVVDLWGGERDRSTGAPWTSDTPIVMYSTTKGVASLALAHAHTAGLFDYDATVATYWPEFAWRGKSDITVRQLLAHQAGLPIVDVPLTITDLGDLDLVAAAIALQPPAWKPGTRHGYHGITLGWYEGELIRRVDPAGRSLGRYFADEIADPLGIDFHIGIPEDFDLERRARIEGRSALQILGHAREMPAGLVIAMVNPRSLTTRAFNNPREFLVDVNFDRSDVLRVEVPAGNGIGPPRAVATAYSAAVTGELGLSAATRDALVQPAHPPTEGVRDLVLHADTSYSLGYLKPTDRFPFGGSAGTAFGTPGNGGSFGFADTDPQIGYCYAPNRLGYGLVDPRELALRSALYEDVLGERPQRPR